MNTVFISHSHDDATAGAEIRDWLHAQDFHSLFIAFDFQDGIAPGSTWERELLRNLRRCDVVLALCSRHYASSRWCFAELVHAKAHEKPIIPVRLDDSPPHELLADVQAVDFRPRATASNDNYAQLRRALADRGIRPQIGGRWTGDRSPYPGLAAFEEADAPVFFGRDEETRNALLELRRLRRPDSPRMLIMLGASGCGKSSLLRAGILPRVRAEILDWIVVDVIRPGAQPLTRMAQALATTFDDRGRPREWQEIRGVLRAGDPSALRDLGEELRYRSGAPEVRVLLIVDQLEEALIQASSGANANALEETPEFLALLLQLSAMREGSYSLLCTLRSDFLGTFQTHPAVQGLEFATLPVAAPSNAGFTRLIEAPAALSGLELEPGLAELMVADTATPDALPLLAFTLRELYEKHAQDRRLTIDEYRASPPAGLGGLQGAVAQSAEDVIGQQNPPLADARLHAVRNTFLSMVALNESGEPARRPVRWSALSPAVHPLIEQFVQARLLVARETDGVREVEVAHETLFRSWGRLRDWLAENRTFLLWRKDLERELHKWRTAASEGAGGVVASARGRPAGRLLRDDDLARARANLMRYGDLLSAEERDYIDTSIKADRRRRRILRGAVAAIIIFLAGAALYARQQSVRATERASAAKQATLLATARAFATDPTRAGALMRESNASTLEFQGRKATILEGHTQPVRAVAFSPDSKLVLTASEDGTARIWNVDGTGEPVVLKVDRSAVTVAAFHPDGKRVVTGSNDNKVRLWNVDGSGQPTVLAGHTQPIGLAVFSPDGRRLVTAARRPFDFIFKSKPDNALRIWGLESANDVTVLTGHTSAIVGAAFLPSGMQVVTASEDGSTRIWNVNDPQRPTLLHAGEPITALAVSPDGATIAVGTPSGAVHFWVAPSWRHHIVGRHNGAVSTVVFAPRGELVVTGSDDGTASMWKLGQAGALQRVVLSSHVGGVIAAAVNPDGTQIVVVSADNKARLWTRDGTPSSPLSPLLTHLLTLKSDGFTFAQVFQSLDRAEGRSMIDQMRRFDEDLSVLSGHGAGITAVAWSPDGRRIATTSADNSARIWRLDGPQGVGILRSRASAATAWTLSDDGERLAETRDGVAEVRNADGSGVPARVPQPDPAVAVVFGADANSVWTGSTTGAIRMWQLDQPDARVVALLNHKPGAVTKLLLDRDRKRLAALSAGAVSLWDIADVRRAREIQTVADISAGRFTPDGSHFVAEKSDTFQIIDTRSGSSRVLLGSSEYVRARSGFRLTADGRSIVSCYQRAWNDREPVYLLWDMRADREWPAKLTEYQFDGTDLTAAGREPLRLDPEGVSVGDPCTASGGTVSTFITSANGRRMGLRVEFPNGQDEHDKTLDVWTIVTIVDAQTLLWKQIDYCFSAQDRMTRLGESAREAEQARQCCQRTVSACRDATLDACATVVKKNYRDPVNPCAR